MKQIKFNDSWKYWKDENSFALIWSTPDHAESVSLPHDAMLNEKASAGSRNHGNTGYRDGAIYHYVKMLYAPEAYKDQTVMLKFEGVYMNAFVYVNGELAGKCPYGYSTFYVTLNDYLRYGQENEIRVVVRNGAMTNSRWYSGSGIYRDVYLLTAPPVYLCPEGVQITTVSLDEEYAVLEVRTKVKNRYHYPQEIKLNTSIRDEEGKLAALDSIPVALYEGEEKTFCRRIAVAKPKAWSENTPYIYSCRTTICSLPVGSKPDEDNLLKEGYVLGAGNVLNADNVLGAGNVPGEGNLLDEAETTCGLRILELDSKRGLRINGKSVKLRGACIHHDNGLLGAATYEDAEYRRIKLLKKAGFNAVRMAHHPMSQAMLRACDKLGMYVMDEAFDMWTRFKSDYDYAQSFGEWWEHDIEAMVQKDYNHPSVLLYSIGNEIPEIGSFHGAKFAKLLSDKVKTLDPGRYTLAAINGVFAAGEDIPKIMQDIMRKPDKDEKENDIAENDEAKNDIATKDEVKNRSESDNAEQEEAAGGNVNEFLTILDSHIDEIVTHPLISKRLDIACATTDIAGYNYMTARYESDAVNYPNRVIVGSETYPPEIGRNWEIIKKSPHVIGDFTWTGWDYIGEAGVGIPAYQFGEGGFGAGFPCQLAYCGDIDITGFRRPVSYFREIVFGRRNAPYIAVQNPAHYGERLIKTPWVLSDSISTWTFHGFEEKPVIVEVYSAGDEVELFQDGISLGKKPAGSSGNFIALFETTYRQGKLTAVSYQAGTELGRMELETAGEAYQITICPELKTASLCDQELVYVPVQVTDMKGILRTDMMVKITAAIEGPAEIAGFGSGNPKPLYNYNEIVTETYEGRALLILKKTGTSGTIQITVDAEDFQKVTYKIEL